MDSILLIKVVPTAADEAVSFLVNGRDLIDIVFEHGGIALGLPLRLITEERRFTIFTELRSPIPERLVVLASEYGWSGITAVTGIVGWSEAAVTWSELAPAWRRRLTKISQIGRSHLTGGSMKT
jgi:hypothetical protein